MTRIAYKGVHIVSHTPLTAQERSLLCLGLKFTIPPTHLTETSVINDEVRRFTNKLIWRYVFQSPPAPVKRPQLLVPSGRAFAGPGIPPQFAAYPKFVLNDYVTQTTTLRMPRPSPWLRVVQLLRSRTDIIIKPADKNLGPVVMSKSDYETAVHHHLDDSTTYQVHEGAYPNDDIFDLIVNTFTVHAKQVELDEKKYYEHFCQLHHSQVLRLPRFYIIPKVHKGLHVWKHNTRPIVDGKLSLLHFISNILDANLRQYIDYDSPHATAVKDTTSFINHIERFQLPATQLALISLDIKSLYTNIDRRKCRAVVASLLVKHHVPTQRRRFLIALLDIVFQFPIFEFNSKLYRQLFGLFMGDPASPTLAILYLQHYEQRMQVEPFWPLFYKRYIDDVFVITPADQVDTFLAAYRTHLPTPITFDSPAVSTQKVQFLDVELFFGHRAATLHILDLKSYAKPINLFLYLPFTSYHPMATKRAWIKAELIRLVKLNSSYSDFLWARQLFYACLRQRGYPPRFIKQVFNEVQHDLRASLLDTRSKRASDVTVLTTTYNPVHHREALKHSLRRFFCFFDGLFPPTRPLVAYRQPPSSLRRLLTSTSYVSTSV